MLLSRTLITASRSRQAVSVLARSRTGALNPACAYGLAQFSAVLRHLVAALRALIHGFAPQVRIDDPQLTGAAVLGALVFAVFHDSFGK